MPKAKHEKADLARDLYRTGHRLVDVAAKLGVPPGTVRRWKSVYGWDGISKTSVREKPNARNALPEEDLPTVVDSPQLTEKQRLFILYYAKNFNATRAYQKAYGCSYATALTEGPAALGNPRIREEILKVKRKRCAKALLEPGDVFQKYLEIAFADLTDFVEFGQEEVPVMAMYGPVQAKDPETGEKVPLTKTVSMVRARPSEEVDGTLLSEVSQGKDGFKIKLPDRMKALQWLGEHMDLATEEQRARIGKLQAETRQLSGEAPAGAREDDPITKSLKEAAHAIVETTASPGLALPGKAGADL